MDSDTVMDNLALDVTQLVVERSVVIQALLKHKPEVFDSLFEIYLNHMRKVKLTSNPSYFCGQENRVSNRSQCYFSRSVSQ